MPILEYYGGNSPFHGTKANKGTVYVQIELVEAYKAAPGWNEWRNILPIDAYGKPDGIGILTMGEDGESVIYDLQGRKVQTPQRGGLYIQNGKKFIQE